MEAAAGVSWLDCDDLGRGRGSGTGKVVRHVTRSLHRLVCCAVFSSSPEELLESCQVVGRLETLLTPCPLCDGRCGPCGSLMDWKNGNRKVTGVDSRWDDPDQ